MSIDKHPIAEEDLMAYLDGELSPDQAVAAAEHLKKCRDCQSIAGDLQGISRRMMAWQVESPEGSKLTQGITAALDEQSNKTEAHGTNRRSWRDVLRLPRLPRWIWASGISAGIAVVILIGFRLDSTSNGFLSKQAMTTRSTVQVPLTAPASDGTFSAEYGARKGFVDLQQGKASVHNYVLPEEVGGSSLPTSPMIVRTAALTLTTKEFEKARAGLEQALKRHGGYVGQLNVSAPSGGGRTLNATLRVPGDQLDATMAELKKLGRVDGETQSGEEVTQQYVDLVARLANARNSEQRLTEILRQRTGKLSDVLAVEVEIDRVRGEIERMEAERKNLAHQVDFATLSATLTEEYENELQAVPVSTFTRIRNAAVDGYTSMTESVIGLVLFLFSYGPNILLWGGLLFLVLRFVWKKLRKSLALN